MSSRKLRRQAAELIKKHGLGKLYYGRGRIARNELRSYKLREIIQKLSYKPGDLVQDCDGFNHNIVKFICHYSIITSYKSLNKERSRHTKTWVINDVDQFEKEDGTWSCGCNISPDDPWTREEVEAYHLLTDEQIKTYKEGGWSWTDLDQKRQDILKAGGHICDEEGRLLPEFKRNYIKETEEKNE